jgi:hypothetical protein
MPPRSPEEAEYRFLMAPCAAVRAQLAINTRGKPEVQLFGNRAGLLSLANVLLWLVANAWRREFLALAELPFVRAEAALSICIRMTDAEPNGTDGLLVRLDCGEQFEWVVSEDDLRRVALSVHRLASKPQHEYDYLQMAEGSAAGIHVRMTDAAEWMQGRIPGTPSDEPREPGQLA